MCLSSFFFLLLLFACASSHKSYIFGDPGLEPWNQLLDSYCRVNPTKFYEARNKSMECIQEQTKAGPMSVCHKLKERNKCIIQYYNTLKECFVNEHMKKDIQEAYEAQKEGTVYYCKENGQEFRDMTGEDTKCMNVLTEEATFNCATEILQTLDPDSARLFSKSSCKVIRGIQKCNTDAMKRCKTDRLSKFYAGQVDAMLSQTPCHDVHPTGGNGGSNSVGQLSSGDSVFLRLTPLLLFLVIYGVF